MALIIWNEGYGTLAKAIVYVIIIVLVLVILYVIWFYLIQRYINGKLLPPKTVVCTAGPAAPTDLSGYISNNRAYLKWTATAKTDNYTLYVGKTPSFSLDLAERTITVTGTSVAVLNLIPINYYFKLKSNNSCGSSGLSNEIGLAVTTWPATFKLCKGDSPDICLSLSNPSNPGFVSQTCPNDSCTLTYVNQEHIKVTNRDLCLDENNPGGTVIEIPTDVEPCATATNWTINLSNGRVTTADGLCMGAPTAPGASTFNTQCSLISNPDDTRYAWVVQATTF
jgi:hypothetical protein